MTSFTIDQKRVDVFASAVPDRPVIYLETSEAGRPLYQRIGFADVKI